MRERLLGSYHLRWLGRSIRGMFTTWGGLGSVAFAVGVPIVVAWSEGVTWDDVGPFIVVTALFLGAAFVLQLILAPRQMEREMVRGQEMVVAAAEPTEAIGTINDHLEEGRRITTRLRRVPPDATDDEWTAALRESVDWVYKAGALVDEFCLGVHDDYVTLRRSIPTVVRDAGRNEDGSPWVSGRRVPWAKWMVGGSTLLRDCIERIERRSHA